MAKNRIQPKTGFALGIAGTAFSFAAGVFLLALGQPSNFLYRGALAFYGAMLLFLAYSEQGEAKQKRRTKLFLLVIALLVSFFNLPPLSNILEMLLFPLLALLYKGQKYTLPFFLLTFTEVAQLVLQMLALANLFSARTLLIIGLALAVTSLARFWMLLCLYRDAAQLKPVEKEDAIHRLR